MYVWNIRLLIYIIYIYIIHRYVIVCIIVYIYIIYMYVYVYVHIYMYTHVYTFDMTDLYTLHNNKHVQCNNNHTHVCTYSCIINIYTYLVVGCRSSSCSSTRHGVLRRKPHLTQCDKYVIFAVVFQVSELNQQRRPFWGPGAFCGKLWNKLKKEPELWQTFVSSDFSYTSYVFL